MHWIRHGRVASHQGDIPITTDALEQGEAVGRQFAEQIHADEQTFVLYAPTRRTRETAHAIHRGIETTLSNADVRRGQVFAPEEHPAVRNPDLYVGGKRVEMVSSPQAMAEQTRSHGIDEERLVQVPFLRGFWASPDRIGYWVSHADPPGEDADTVARRVLIFATSLLHLPPAQPRRYICVTHSPVMRAFLRRYLLGHDPGEPDYGEAIDMLFAASGALTLRFREASVTLPE
jgi:broad specificity phosphatase PhoE